MSEQHDRYIMALTLLKENEYQFVANTTSVGMVLPHLDFAELTQLLEHVGHNDVTYVIGPPLAIRGAEQLFAIINEGGELYCRWSGTYRRKESFFNRVPNSFIPKIYDYRDRVANFAETYWGESLIWDKSNYRCMIKVVDPRKLNRFNQLDVRATGAMLLDTTFQELEDSTCYPLPQCIEQATFFTTANAFKIAEILSSHGPHRIDVFCAICGAGLGENECSFCGASLVPHTQLIDPRDYPISLKIADKLDWEFEIEPDQALRAYYMDWGNEGLTIAPKSNRKRSRERNIQLRDNK